MGLPYTRTVGSQVLGRHPDFSRSLSTPMFQGTLRQAPAQTHPPRQHIQGVRCCCRGQFEVLGALAGLLALTLHP